MCRMQPQKEKETTADMKLETQWVATVTHSMSLHYSTSTYFMWHEQEYTREHKVILINTTL